MLAPGGMRSGAGPPRACELEQRHGSAWRSREKHFDAPEGKTAVWADGPRAVGFIFDMDARVACSVKSNGFHPGGTLHDPPMPRISSQGKDDGPGFNVG
jgi:hypothetical protein